MDQRKLDERTAEAGVAVAQVAGIACRGVDPEAQHVVLVGMATSLLGIAITSLVRHHAPGRVIRSDDPRYVACLQGWAKAMACFPEVGEIERQMNETRDAFVEALHQ